MPPKQKCPKVVGESSRASKRKKGNESAPIPTIDLSPPYSNVRLMSPAAEQNYSERYAKRPVLCERGIMLERFDEPPCDLLSLITAKGWQIWVKFQNKAIVPLVKEFYSNVTSDRDDSRNRCLVTEVRKVKIELKPSDIAETFQILREASPRDHEEASVDLGKENLAKILTEKDDAVWLGPALPKKNLSPKCIILHRLLCSHFMPHAFTGSVSVKQAVFMGKMILGVHIDLAKHIFDTIDLATKHAHGSGGLPFGGLITYFLLRNGVKEKTTFEVIKPMERISPTSARRSSGQLKRVEATTPEKGEASGKQVEPQEGPSQEPPLFEDEAERQEEESTLGSLFKLVKEMQEKQERHEALVEQALKKIQEKQEAIFEELQVRQRVIHSEVMAMSDRHTALDKKIGQLLSTPMEEPPLKALKDRLDDAESYMQRATDLWLEEGGAPTHPQSEHAAPLHSAIPSSSSVPPAEPLSETPSGSSTEENSTKENSTSDDATDGTE